MPTKRWDTINSGVYNIKNIASDIEIELISNMARQLSKGSTLDIHNWQTQQLLSLAKFRTTSSNVIRSSKKQYEKAIQDLVRVAAEVGVTITDEELQKLKKETPDGTVSTTLQFFKINKNFLKAHVKSALTEGKDVVSNALRYQEDIFRQVVYKVGVLRNSGNLTTLQAIDKATKTFLDSGIQSIQYKNNRTINIASYSEMAMRSNAQRISFKASGIRRSEYGTRLVKINTIGICCELCARWQGKVYNDDVYQTSGDFDDNYPLLSDAYANGFGHPNCRHDIYTYYSDVVSETDSMNDFTGDDDSDTRNQLYQAEQQQRAFERQIRKWKRRSAGSVDPDNISFANSKVKEYQSKLRSHLKENPPLTRQYHRERISPSKLSTPISLSSNT